MPTQLTCYLYLCKTHRQTSAGSSDRITTKSNLIVLILTFRTLTKILTFWTLTSKIIMIAPKRCSPEHIKNVLQSPLPDLPHYLLDPGPGLEIQGNEGSEKNMRKRKKWKIKKDSEKAVILHAKCHKILHLRPFTLRGLVAEDPHREARAKALNFRLTQALAK